MKRILITIGIICFLYNGSVKSQVFQTWNEVVKNLSEERTKYEIGIANDGTTYIQFFINVNSNKSGLEIQAMKTCYFEYIKNERLCIGWMVILPLSETNSTIIYYKNNFVEIGRLKWKDYRQDVIYKVDVQKDFCAVICMYDFNN